MHLGTKKAHILTSKYMHRSEISKPLEPVNMHIVSDIVEEPVALLESKLQDKRKAVISTKTSESENTQNTRNRKRNEYARKTRAAKMHLEERIINESPDKEFIVDELVLATVPGYCPWPARILSITSQTIIVEFFGTGQM